MIKKIHNSPIFADEDHLLFTAQVLSGDVNLGKRLSPYHAGDMLVPLAHLSESIQDIVQGIIATYKLGNDEVSERESKSFQEQYNETLGDKIIHYRQQGLAKEAVDYNEKHVPVLAYQQNLFDEPLNPFQYLAFQGAEGMLGKYVELIIARILNGTIIDLNGTLPDIAVQTREGVVYIESKAARFSNREKYLAPSGTKRYVSRNGFFAKRNQIHSALATEKNSMESTTYMALVDYDFVGGGDMTFSEFVKSHPETFGKIQYDHELKSLPERLRDTVIIKSILLIPTWAAFMVWNANIIRTRPLDKFTQGKLYKNERHPVAQYFDVKHVEAMKEFLKVRGVPRNIHTISGIQETPINIETFGHTFLPFESITL